MVKIRFKWREDVPAKTLLNEQELDASFVEVARNARSAGQRHLVELQAENGNTLSIALGGEDTVLVFGCPENDPPYFTCRGVEGTLHPVLVCYSLGTHHTEVPRWFVIPLEQGMRGVKAFAATGERPSEGTWQES